MADYRKVAQHFPAVRDYLRHRKWVRRGDVTAYAPGIETASFSTDEFGFRHTVFAGERFGIADIGRVGRYSLVFGSSHVFGFGLASNADTFASCLSEALGHPCLGVSFPEADTRTLHTTLLRILGSSPRPPDRIILMMGGTVTRFAFTGICDPVFGSPDFKSERRVAFPDELAVQLRHLEFFMIFWMEQFVQSARSAGVRLTIAEELTFFEKSTPDAIEADCALGTPSSLPDRSAIYRRAASTLFAVRARFIDSLSASRAKLYRYDDYSYIDEYHYRAEAIKMMTPLLI